MKEILEQLEQKVFSALERLEPDQREAAVDNLLSRATYVPFEMPKWR